MKKKLMSLLLCLSMVLSLLPAVALPALAASASFTGDGTLENPYQITTADQLKLIGDANISTNGDHRYYKLMNNLTNVGATGIDTFTGTLDGNGMTISGLNGRLVMTNNGTIRHLKLVNPVFDSLTAPNRNSPVFEKDYDREIVGYDSLTGAPYYQRYGSEEYSVLNLFMRENIGFAAGINSGVIDNVTVQNGSINAFYTTSNITLDGTADSYYTGMEQYIPSRIGGIAGSNLGGKIRNCTISTLTIHTDSAAGVTGGITGYNQGKLLGCVTDGMSIVPRVTAHWTNLSNGVRTWAVGGIAGWLGTLSPLQSDYSNNAHSYNNSSVSKADLKALGWWNNYSAKEDAVLKDVTANADFDLTAWNDRVTANTYPGVKARESELVVTEDPDITNMVEVRNYQDDGTFLGATQQTKGSAYSIPQYTYTAQGDLVNNSVSYYTEFVNRFDVKKTGDGTSIKTGVSNGTSITLDNSVDVTWAMPLTPYLTCSTTTQQGQSFTPDVLLVNQDELYYKNPASLLSSLYENDADGLAALKSKITVTYQKDGKGDALTTIPAAGYGDYTVSFDVSTLDYPSRFLQPTTKPHLWYIGPLTAAQAPISNRVNTYTGSPVSAVIPRLNGVSGYEVWYTGTGSTTYAASQTAPSTVGTYTVTVKNLAAKLDGTTYADCWQATDSVDLGTMTIADSGMTLYTNGSTSPSTDSKFAVTYTDGTETKSLSFAAGSTSIATGSIPSTATGVKLTYNGAVVQNLTDFDSTKAYVLNFNQLTVLNVTDANTKGKTILTDETQSFSNYDGVLQYWVPAGKTLGEMLTGTTFDDSYTPLVFDKWVDSDDPATVYESTTQITPDMKIAAHYTDPTDKSGFEVGGLYYFADETDSLNTGKSAKHYVGYYGGSVRSAVGTVTSTDVGTCTYNNTTSTVYKTSYAANNTASVHRLFLSPSGAYWPDTSYASASEYAGGYMGSLYQSYFAGGHTSAYGTERLPENGATKPNQYTGAAGYWGVNPWNDLTQLFVNLGKDKGGAAQTGTVNTKPVYEIGLRRSAMSIGSDSTVSVPTYFSYRDSNGKTYSNDITSYTLETTKSSTTANPARLIRMVYDASSSLTTADTWVMNIHLLPNTRWYFSSSVTGGDIQDCSTTDTTIHYVMTNSDTQSVTAPVPSSNPQYEQVKIADAGLTSILWKDQDGNFYTPGSAVPKGTTDLTMVDASTLLTKLTAAECTAAGLDPSTYTGYYPIRTPADLQLLRQVMAGAAGSFSVNAVLLNDLDLSAETDWKPLGYTNTYISSCIAFSGVFDGNGHSISHLNSTKGGLIAKAKNSTIKDLTMASGKVATGTDYAGALIGHSSTNTTLLNCVNFIPVSGGDYIGGLIGGAYGDLNMTGCCNYGTATGKNWYNEYVGGLAGQAGGGSGSYTITFTDCCTLGKLYGTFAKGTNANFTSDNCYVTTTNVSYPANLTEAQIASGEAAWMLNTKNGTVTNTGKFAQVNGYAVPVRGTQKPTYRVTFSGTDFTTVYAYTGTDGKILSMPANFSGKLLTYDTNQIFTASTVLSADTTVTVSTPASEQTTAAPVFATSNYYISGTTPKVGTFTLTQSPADGTVYAVYSSQTAAGTAGTATVSGTTMTVTLNTAPTADTTYYVTAQESGKAESAAAAITYRIKPDPAFTTALTAQTIEYSDTLAWSNTLSTGDGAVTFSSSDSTVASVDQTSGLVTANKIGTAVITVHVAEGANNVAKDFTYQVTVTQKDVTRTGVELTRWCGWYGEFEEPSFDGITGTTTYTTGNYRYATAKALVPLRYQSAGTTKDVSFTFTANGNCKGTITGTIHFTVVSTSFTGSGITAANPACYGNTWSELLQVDPSKYTAALVHSGQADVPSTSARYYFVIVALNGDYTNMDPDAFPVPGTYNYSLLCDGTYNDNGTEIKVLDCVSSGSINVVMNAQGDGLTVSSSPTYGDNWGDILALDAAKYTTTFKGVPVTGTYRVQVKSISETFADMNASAMPAPDNYSYRVLFTSTDKTIKDALVTNGYITVAKRTAALQWSGTSFPYDGTAKAPTATVSNAVTGDTVNVTVKVTGDHTMPGSYTATAASLDNTKYVLPTVNTQDYSITKTAGTSTLTVDHDTLTYGGSVTLTATVPTEATGSVTFKNGTTTLGTADISGATATLTYATTSKGLAVGDNTITAEYSGDSIYSSSTATAKVTLNQKALAGSVSGVTKAYDGKATFSNIPVTLSGVETGDTVTATAGLTAASANAGSSIAIFSATMTLDGAQKDWYTAPVTLTGTVTITSKAVTNPVITLSPASYTYTGSPIVPTGVTVKDGTVTISESEYTVECSNNTNVGSAAVTISDNQGGNYTVSGSVAFAITSAAVTNHDANQTISFSGTTYNVSQMFTKDTNAGTPAYSIVPGGTGTGTLDGSNLTITKAGTIEIQMITAAADNYAAGAPVTATLTVSKGTGSGSVTLTGWTYGGTAATRTPASTTNGTANVSYLYKVSGAEDATYTTAVPTNAGNYTVKATFAANDLYESCTATTDFTIAKVADAAASTSATVLYSDTTGKTLSLADAVSSFKTGSETLSYNITSTAANLAADPSIDSNGNLHYALKSGLAAADATETVTAEVTGFNNYAKVTVTATINISNATPVTVSIDNIILNGKTYDGRALSYTGTASGTYNSGTAYSGTFSYVWQKAGGSVLTDAPTDAGSYKLVVTATSIGFAGYAEKAVTISKSAVVAKADSKSMTIGGTLPTFTVSYSGIASGDTADSIFSTKASASCTADGKTAGNYDIAVTTPVLKTEATKNYTVGSSVGGTLTVSNPAPVAPGGSTDTGTKVTIPVSSNEGSVKVEATVKDGTAAVTITDAQINEIASGKSDTGTVKMDVSSLDVKAATVPAKVIAAADSSTSATGVEVALPTGTVTLDKTALAAVSDKGGDVTVSVEKIDNSKLTETQKEVLGTQAETALVIDVTVLASGKTVSAFNGGSVGVAVPYTPKAGEDTSKLVVWFVKDDGSIEPKTGFYNAKTGKYEFQTQHLSQYVLVSFPFKDVSASSWYYGNVAYAYMNGLFSGTGDTTFSPETTMTRGMLVTVLWRMEGSPAVTESAAFTDVAADAYYAKAVAWASANKLVDGYGNGSFGPNDAITREQMAAILYRYASLKAYDTSGAASLDGFADSASVSDYAKSALSWAVNGGLVKGSDNKLMPGNGATRAQVAAILQRFQQKIVK